MPYIKQEERKKYETHLAAIEHILLHLPVDKAAGEFTYVIYRLLKRFNGVFATRAVGMGCVVAAILEMYRQDHAPYEDQKQHENGDVLQGEVNT
jgi:hypothetical protein